MARYRILPEKSTVNIDARSSLHPIKSHMTGLEGFVELEVQGGGKINLTVPPAGELSFPVERLRTGNPLEDRELRKRVDARRFPTISGRLTELKPTGRDGRYLVRGDLTFLGVTRSYEDEMNIAPVDDDTIRLTGQSRFDVRDFGLEPPRILMLKVEPEVDVSVELLAKKGG